MRALRTVVVCLAMCASVSVVTCQSSTPTTSPYAFDGSMSRDVLEKYLSRSITMMSLLNGFPDSTDANIQMLIRLKAKFAGRVIFVWGQESTLPGLLSKATQIAVEIHRQDPEMILQAAILEVITPDVDNVAVPAWVFDEFGLPDQTRNFNYSAMLYSDGYGVDYWGAGNSMPDMSKLETRMWFYYAARQYIDIGIEAIHFGQVLDMDKADPDHTYWWDMLSHVRSYAAAHARRHMVLCDAHVPNGGITLSDGRLLFDFHSMPLRIESVANTPMQGMLQVGYHDSIYGQSKGGVTPSGWSCQSLPYLVEFDNYFISSSPGTDVGYYWIWGYDEITWFYMQTKAYRTQWLNYAWNWIAINDPNGHLEMPGSRVLEVPPNWFYAFPKSSAEPLGQDLESSIDAIWNPK